MSCPSDKELNLKTGRCIKKCAVGQERNLETMRCVASKKTEPTKKSAKKTAPKKTARKKVEPTPPPQQIISEIENPPPSCKKDEEYNDLTKKCLKKCNKTQERNPKTARCIKKCPTGQIRNINTMKCIPGKTETKTPKLKNIMDDVKKEIKQEKKEEKLINKSIAKVKIHKFPKDNNDTISIFIYSHGEVLEFSYLMNKMYWHSHNPNNGCVVKNFEIDNKPLNQIIYSLYKNTDKKDGELHNHVLTNYCNLINQELNYTRSFKFLMIVIIAYIRFVKDSLDLGDYTNILDGINSINKSTVNMTKPITDIEEKKYFKIAMDIMKRLEGNYNKMRKKYYENPQNDENNFKANEKKWEYLLNILFLYNVYKDKPKVNQCNKFKRIQKNKIYNVTDSNKEIEKGFGVYVLYDTKKVNPFPELYEKGTNKLKLGKTFYLSHLHKLLKDHGYKNIYIYEFTCNYNSNCNYSVEGQEGYKTKKYIKLDTLAKSLSVRTKTASSL